jgi:transposase
LHEAIREAGVRLEYLPPYSPDFNPIEEAFAEIKAWIKTNKCLAEGYNNFGDFLQIACEYMHRKPGNHFHSCHILM